MAYVLNNSVNGLFMVNSSIAVCVVANAWNPIMPVRSICIFSATLVVVNFFMVLLVMPPTLVIYDKIEQKCWKRNKEEKETDIFTNLDEQYSGIDRFFGDKFNACVS